MERTRVRHIPALAGMLLVLLVILGVFATPALAATTWSNQTPPVNGTVTVTNPTISVKVTDPAGIGWYSRSAKLDGVRKTPTYNATTGVMSLATSGLAYGPHTVYFSVNNNSGVASSTQWTFTIGGKPTIGALSPADGSTCTTDRPSISAAVSPNNGTLTAWTMKVDGATVSATWDAASGLVSYKPVARLKNDAVHTVSLDVTNSGGLTTSISWSFNEQIYADMADTAGCTDCHLSYPAAHPMNNCPACHGANSPVGEWWNTPDYSAHSSSYLGDCAGCHNGVYPSVPGHVDVSSKHLTGADMSGCACHVKSITIEHNRWSDEAGNALSCTSCHGANASQRVKDALAAGSTNCRDCHDLPAGHPYGEVDHVADNGATALAGTSFTCGDCHTTDLMTEHEKSSSSSAGGTCSTCHPLPRDTFDVWNDTCSQGGCHATGSSTAIHANQASSHAFDDPNASCLASGCHGGPADLAAMHSAASTETPSGGRTSCLVCHADGVPTTKVCADCHPDRVAEHGYKAELHTPTSSTSLSCQVAGCHVSTDVGPLHANRSEGKCAVCHANPTKGDLVSGKTSANCEGCHITSGVDYHKDFSANHTFSGMSSSCQASGCHSNSLVTTHQSYVGTGSRYPQYANTCALCHANTDSSRIPANATSDCASCHTIHGDLTQAHASSTTCYGTCHTSQVESASHVSSCSTCHSSTADRIVAAISTGNTKCVACHRASSSYVDASGQAYVLVGAEHDAIQPQMSSTAITFTVNPAAPTVTWTTDRPCTTYVDYTASDWSYDGENFSGYTYTTGSASLTTTHSVSFPAPDRSSSSGFYYHYRIRTTDAQGHTAVTSKRIYHRNRNGNTAVFPYGYEPDYASLNTDVLKLNVIRPDGSRAASAAVSGWESQSVLASQPTPSSPGAPAAQASVTNASEGYYYGPAFWRTKLATADGNYNWQVAKFKLDSSLTASMQGLELDWTGYAENSAGHPVVMYLWNFDKQVWERIDSRQSTGDNTGLRFVDSTDAAQTYCLRCHATPVSTSVTVPSNLTNMRAAWTTDFHGTAAGSGYGGTLKSPYVRGNAALSCDTCHDPNAHGSSTNPYKLKTSVNGSSVSVTSGTTAVSLCAACHEGTPNDFHASCIACHETFVPTYHNATGNAPKDFTGLDCLSCHAHGKTGYAPGCHSCHNETGAGPWTTF